MVGFCPWRATVVAFYHAEREVRIVVHGDDFVVEGRQSDLEWVRDVLAAKYILKVRGILGPEQGDQKSIVVLGRVVDWRADELWWGENPAGVRNGFRKSVGRPRSQAAGGGRGMRRSLLERI